MKEDLVLPDILYKRLIFVATIQELQLKQLICYLERETFLNLQTVNIS